MRLQASPQSPDRGMRGSSGISGTISVVIPAYNAEACLRATLESALAQTYPAHEILVVDDGSKDETAAVTRSFGDRVRLISQANQGIAGARNTGIREATGEWIAFLDHDDLMRPEKLAKQIAVARSKEALQVVYSAFEYLYTDGSTKLLPVFPARELWPAIRYRTPILPSTSIVRRSALLEIGGFQTIYVVDDWHLWFRMIRRFGTGAFQEMPEALTLYRWWENNESRNFMPMLRASLELLDMLLLEDLQGMRCALWKRKCEARLYHRTAMSLRDAGSDRSWEYAVESFLRWPLPAKMFPAPRFRVLAHMLWTRLRHPRLSFRYWWPVRRCRTNFSVSATPHAGS